MYRVAENFCEAEIVAIRAAEHHAARKNFFPQNFKFLLTKLRKLSPLPSNADPITPQRVDPPYLQRFNNFAARNSSFSGLTCATSVD